jgi:hypothetical protein
VATPAERPLAEVAASAGATLVRLQRLRPGPPVLADAAQLADTTALADTTVLAATTVLADRTPLADTAPIEEALARAA